MMPNFAGHVITGMIALYLFTFLLPTPSTTYLLSTLGLAILCSLLPDIDQDKSHIRKLLFSTMFAAASLFSITQYNLFSNLWVFSIPAGVLFFWIFNPFSHRGITHSLSATAVVGVGIYFLTSSRWLTLVAVATYYSHIFIDFTTTAFGNLANQIDTQKRSRHAFFPELFKVVKMV